ncbi:hypothetical protein ACFSYG_09950 [Leeuwenhoekiella polynyae]|uniref:Uncharacterized protein n=1 Tax=Leeuwenhoekiella polynyae TaxID=1550906 RepID=A0A4Q0PH63_9FLAO|nr:hypothetical protein [Leeuwenhoekiella polynyae]RXG25569.1 hypothetical protein DSM02_735 [Leeuwenhoekiella polynyae]
MTKNQVDTILKSLGYYDSFKELMNQTYLDIDYGKRLGVISFDSIFEADHKYAYNGDVGIAQFQEWNIILNSKYVSEEQILIVCLKIFDWGNVLTGNVKSVVNLYEQKKLKKYIHKVTELLTFQKTLEKPNFINDTILWSSGWTKVYSFINPDILIYDSRVSAFLNFTLIRNYNSLSENQKEIFQKLSNQLFNFSGALGRERKVAALYGFKNQHPKGIDGFNANLISSWITQCTKERLGINKSIRSFEKAFFMLGFDLKQIKDKG